MKEKIKNWFKNNWFKIIAIAFLFGALLDNPYGYYQFLRWVVLAAGAYSAFLAYTSGRKIWTGIFVVIVLLFNPIIPFHFSRDIWQVIDVIVVMSFFVSMFFKFNYASKDQNNLLKNSQVEYPPLKEKIWPGDSEFPIRYKVRPLKSNKKNK